MDDRTAGERPRSCGPRSHGPRTRAWRAAAEDGLARIVAAGREGYDRRRTLPRLIGWDERDLDRDDESLGRQIRARLTRALRAERRRGRAGHWAYDLDRHVALLQALDAEARGQAESAGRDLRPSAGARSSRAAPAPDAAPAPAAPVATRI